jgi:hypothetical protein
MYVLKSVTNGGIYNPAHPNKKMQIRAISHVA